MRVSEKQIQWTSHISEIFKLNFDGSMMMNKSAFGLAINNLNEIIKKVTSKHLCNTLIIIIECIVLRYDVLAIRNNGFLNLRM